MVLVCPKCIRKSALVVSSASGTSRSFSKGSVLLVSLKAALLSTDGSSGTKTESHLLAECLKERYGALARLSDDELFF